MHCLGMCGPIALALPGGNAKGFRYFSGRFLYNTGRITTYSILGALVALFGVAAAMFALQQWVSIAMGIGMLVLALREWGLFGKAQTAKPSAFRMWWLRQMGNLMRMGQGRGLFAMGLLNGILPCGFVYLGLFQAALSDSVWEGAGKMAFFGLGTWPVMLTLSWSGKWLTGALRARARAIMPVVMVLMGAMFMLRGMALGIPYLSPKMEIGPQGKVKMSCCEKAEQGRVSHPPKQTPVHKMPQTPSEETP